LGSFSVAIFGTFEQGIFLWRIVQQLFALLGSFKCHHLLNLLLHLSIEIVVALNNL